MIIKEDIQTITGEKRYCILENKGEYLGMPMYNQIFSGTYEECENYIKNPQEAKKKKQQRLIYKDYEEAFDNLIKAFSEFNDVIDKHKNTIDFNAFIDHETYPFEESFDEYYFLVDGWKEQTLENLEKIEDLEEANRGW